MVLAQLVPCRSSHEPGGDADMVRRPGPRCGASKDEIIENDCPFYGDSAAAEERREEMREQYVDLLVDLGLDYAEHETDPAPRTPCAERQA